MIVDLYYYTRDAFLLVHHERSLLFLQLLNQQVVRLIANYYTSMVVYGYRMQVLAHILLAKG